MKLQTRRNILVLIVLNIICCCFFFFPILSNLNGVMLSSGGDGIKNYFTYLYFIRYDQNVHFTGMNYPFGENIIFTDNMPALAWTIAKIRLLIPGIVQYGLLIMHATFMVAYLLCTVYIHRILVLFAVRGWWAIVSAVFIAYFSPQFLRIFGHFSLGITCFLPMLVYYMIQYTRSRKSQYICFLFLCISIFSFIHVYYLAFSTILIAAYSFSCLLVKGKTMIKKVAWLLPLLFALAAAVCLLKIYLVLTDPVTDRPKYPMGYLDALAKGEDILTSYYNFLGSNALSFFFKTSSQGGEGYAYIGLVSILVLLYLSYRIIKSIIVAVFYRVKIPLHPVRSYRVWLITAFMCLLLAMGIPFIFGLEILIDYFSIFRQFRSLGRFSWIFYYLIMIYSSIVLYRWFYWLKAKKYYKQYVVSASLILAIWLIEWNGYGQIIREVGRTAGENYITFTSNDGGTGWKEWLTQHGYSPEKFQGVIGLSYTHIGSEKVAVQENAPNVIWLGTQIAYQTGLKLADVMMSRTSWSQTYDNLRLIDGPLTPKPVISRYNNKPLLVFVCPETPLTPGEKNLVDHAIFIGERNKVSFYALDVQTMKTNNRKYADSLGYLTSLQPNKDGFLYPASPEPFSYTDHFDGHNFEQPFCGTGAYPASQKEKELLTVIPVIHPTPDSVYSISLWFYSYNDLPNMAYITFFQYDDKETLLSEGDCFSARSTYCYNNWFKAENTLTISSKTKKIKIYVHGGSKRYLALDELLITPVNNTYYYKASDSVLLLNNRPVKFRSNNY